MTAVLSPLRQGRITGSRVAAILGASKYATAEDAMREMVRQALDADPEFVGNEATDFGSAHEADAIRDYEYHQLVTVHSMQDVVLHPNYPDLLLVTPDGLVGDDGMVEVKCPWRARYMTLPEHYEPQVMLQLACTGRAWCDFVIWRDHEPLIVQRIDADPDWLPAVLPALQGFSERYQRIIADPELAAPYLAPLVDARSDDLWARAATRFKAAGAALDDAKAAYESARADVLALADGRPSAGAGIAVSASERKGSVEYAKALAKYAPDADLDTFRKPSTTVFTVRLLADE